MLYIDPEANVKLLVEWCVKGKGTIIINTNFSIPALSFSDNRGDNR